MAKRRQKKASPVKKRSFVRQTHNLAVSPIAECIRNACLPAASLFLALNPGAVFAGPEGGEVAGGQGNISTPNSTTTVINQQSQNLAIDWASFNVNVNELVQFKQPSKTASALNRIHDSNPSQIFGSITANGNVLLVNPNGVFFKPGASVNVNSLTASGLDISTSDFMNGKLNFNGVDGTNGLVVNQGVLQAATGGSINLVGKAVINEGVIIASAGQVNLVAGDQITIDFDGDGLMQFAIDKEVIENAQSLDSAVKNTGEIIAEGGSILLKGSAAKDVFNHVVNNEGMLRAGRIENKGGTIKLIAAGTHNSLINTGTVDATGYGGSGGSIEMTATANVTIAGDSVITASASDADGSIVTVNDGHATVSEFKSGEDIGVIEGDYVYINGIIGTSTSTGSDTTTGITNTDTSITLTASTTDIVTTSTTTGTLGITSGSISTISTTPVTTSGVLTSGGSITLTASSTSTVTTTTNTIQINSEITTADDKSLKTNKAKTKVAETYSTENISQIADATSHSNDGGNIKISAADTTIISDNSQITASSSDGKGGTVQVLGDKVALLDTTTINASGETGGGEILIGGDYKGSNPDIKNAQFTTIAENVKIKADAISEGDGGKVIVWSDDTTRMHGKISARGGDISGNGGFVEVSGKKHLYIDSISQQVDVSALNGEGGTLLLDPNDINIIVAAAGGTVGGSPEDADTINDEDIENFLNGSGSLIIKTNTAGAGGSGDILFANNVSIIWTTASRNLTFNADRSISFGTGVTVNGSASATSVLDFNFGIVTAGSFDISNSPTLTAAGSVTIDGTTAANDSIIGGSAYIVSAANQGTVDGIAFTNVGNLTGTTGVDSFTINAGGLAGAIDGIGGADTLSGTLIDAVVLTGSDADGFAGTEADITGGFDGIQTITGNAGTLTGRNLANTWALDGTPTYNDGANTLNFTGFANLQGGTLTDAFNVTAASTYNLLGGNGIDTFDIDATLTGSIDGETGVDILQGTTIDAVVLTGSDADGFAGTEADITLNFDGIQTITGNAGTLTGRNVASTWALDGTPTYNDGTNTLNLTGFAILQGGTNTDAYNVSAASTFSLFGGAGIDTFDIDATLTGSIDGEAGVDILQGTTIDAVVLTNSSANGFNGTEADITAGLFSIGTITGNAGTLTGRNLASTWALDGTPTYNDGANTLNFTGFANLQGGTLVDTFTVSAASTFNLLGGVGNDIFNINAALTGNLDGEADDDTINFNSTVSGTLTGGAGGSDNDTLVGPNAANAWVINALDAGTLNGKAFTEMENLTGNANDDTFTFGAIGALTGGIDGAAQVTVDTIDYSAVTAPVNVTVGVDLTNIETVTADTANDTLTGSNTANTWGLDGTPTFFDGTNTLNFTGFANLQGGTLTDAFNVTAASTYNLLGGAGIDTFDIDATLTGSIDGEVGVDILQGTTVSATTLTGSDADGFAGTEADITLNFDGIGTLTGKCRYPDRLEHHQHLGAGWHTDL